MKFNLLILWSFLSLVLFAVEIVRAESPDFGDDYTTAYPLTPDGTLVEGNLEDTADEDWFSFVTAADGLYSVTLSTTSGYKYIGVYSLDGTPVVIVPPNIFSTSSSITKTFYLPDAETYYVRIYTTGYEGIYIVSVDQLGVYPADSFSDTCLSPETLVVDDPPQNGIIGPTGTDEDWFSFATSVLGKYEIHFNSADNTNSMYYQLFNTSCGDQIRGNTTTSNITIVSWFGENYDLRLHTNNTTTAWYDVEVALLDSYTDDHGNVYTDATSISSYGITAGGILEYSATYNSDEDWFSFDSSANGLYEITTTTSSGSKAFTVYQLDGGGQLVQLITLSSNDSKVIWLQEEDTYYIKAAMGALGEYSINVDEIDILVPDDYADVCGGVLEPAEIIVNAAPKEGVLDTEYDNDWFRFNGEKLHFYQIVLTPDNGGGTLYFDLYDGCNTSLAVNRTTADFVPQESKEYHLRVFSNNTNRYYEIQITDMGLQPDDHGNSAEAATEILPNGYAYPGSLEYNATVNKDEDWFVFTALHDSTYDVAVVSQSSSKGIRIYEEQPDLSLVQILNVSTYNSRTDPISVLEDRQYFIQIYLGAQGSYTVAVLGPDPICGDLAHPFPMYDYNMDCYVNLTDFASFADEWLNCTDPAPPCLYNP